MTLARCSSFCMPLPHNVVEVLARLLPMSLLREEFEKVRYAEVVKVLAL